MINKKFEIFLIDIDSISFRVRDSNFGHTGSYSPCNIKYLDIYSELDKKNPIAY
jgi:hypothetical protein